MASGGLDLNNSFEFWSSSWSGGLTYITHRPSTSKINRLWRCWQQTQDISVQRRWPGWRRSHRAIMARHHSRASAAKNTLTWSDRDDEMSKGTLLLEQLHNSQESENLYSTLKSKSTCCQVFCTLDSRIARNCDAGGSGFAVLVWKVEIKMII